MGKTVERIELPETAEEITALAAAAGLPIEEYVDRTLAASAGGQLTNRQAFAMLVALPKRDIPSSADDIRQLRGPLPEVEASHSHRHRSR